MTTPGMLTFAGINISARAVMQLKKMAKKKGVLSAALLCRSLGIPIEGALYILTK
jgi:hypothetical protein